VTTQANIAAVLLAAGASSRMGRPKPLLDFRGETFLDRQIALYKRECRTVIVVLGYAAQEIAGGLNRADEAVLVLNPRPERGQLSSLQCGLRALPSGCEAAFFLPVDSPGVRAETVRALISAWRSQTEKPDFVIPREGGRRGHPVLLRPALAAQILALPEGATARDVIHAHSDSTLYVELDDSWIHRDIDTPADYAALVAEVEA